MMKSLKLTILILVAFASEQANAQLFRPLGLGIETPGEMVQVFQPQIHVEGDNLFACTKQGLYSKDLSEEGSEWQLVGFEGIPVLDYVRRGNDIFALCLNGPNDIFLLSHDGGRTYEDATPESLRNYTNSGSHVFWYLHQHPADCNTFLISSFWLAGTFITNDFGQTWKKLAAYTSDNMGFHPLKPEIIYECGGGGFTDEKADFRISYDGGQTWEDKSGCFPQYCVVYRMAFHPTDPDRWIAGGNRQVFTTNDNGQTWKTQYLKGDESINDYYAYSIDWRYAAYDNENPDTIYLAGGHQTQHMKLICSTDGGATWNRPYLEPIKTTTTEYMFDMKQYGDKLLIYSQSDVYEVSKAELIGLTTPVTFTTGQMATIILPSEPEAGKGKYYKLDRVDGTEIVFEQELQPRAHVPYIIVPSEDFTIDPGTLDLAGLKPDTVSVGSISFIGTYVRTELPALTGGDGEWRPFPPSLGGDGGGFYRIIDTTPDCSPLPAEGQGERLAFVGTLRAYLTWDDPYGPGATKGPEEEMKIVLHDRGTGSLSPAPSPEGEGRKDAAIYDLSGKMVNGKWLNGKSPKGIYIKDRKKWVKPFK